MPLISEMDDHPKLDESEDLPKAKLQGPVANGRVSHGMDEEDKAATCRENLKKDENDSHNVLRSEEGRASTHRGRSEKVGTSHSDELQSMTMKSEAPFYAESRVESKSVTSLTVPKNSCQFQAHWKVLRKKEYDFFVYFKVSHFTSFRFVSVVCFFCNIKKTILRLSIDYFNFISDFIYLLK